MISPREFDRLFRDNHRALCLFAHRWVSEDEAWRDLVSSAFEDLWTLRDRVEPGTARALLFKMVHDKSVDYLRHQKHVRSYADYVATVGSSYLAHNDYDKQIGREHIIQRCLAMLKPPVDAIFKAVFCEGKKYQEVADEMGFTLSFVKKHMAQALNLIRENIKNIKS